MGLFGKILLVLNLLISGGFFYLAVQDWQGRQAIQGAGLRHIMALEGLQLQGGPDTMPARVTPGSDGYSDFASQEIPFAIEGPGGVMTKSVSPALLYAYFDSANDPGAAGLGGNMAVASQMAEAKRVFGALKAMPDEKRGPIIAEALLRLAENFEERSEYLEWVSKGNVAELIHAMDIRFHRVIPDAVKNGPMNPDLWGSLDARINELAAQRDAAKKAADDAQAAGNAAEEEKKRGEAGAFQSRIDRRRTSEPKDETDRKFRLAHLLVHLDASAGWQKRVALVVGLRMYVKAVDGQSGKFKEIFDRVEQAIVVDQERFVGQYSQLRTMAIQRTQLVLEMAEIRAQLTIQAQKDQDLVNQRTGQLKDLQSQLQIVKQEVNDLLARQTLVEQNLFLVERAIGLKLEDIYRMEAELKQRERDRYDQKK